MEIKNTLKNEKGVITLMRNGHDASCHLKAPTLIMVQKALVPEPGFMQIPCSSTCPKFMIAGGTHICTADGNALDISDAPENNPSQLKLI